jgi:flavin-binding protein dodecin
MSELSSHFYRAVNRIGSSGASAEPAIRGEPGSVTFRVLY